MILIDIGLPGMDGYELARTFRRDPQFHAIPLVALTGYVNDSDQEHAAMAGFNQHLSKPVSLESVQKLLATLPRKT